MNSIQSRGVRTVADLHAGQVLATAQVAVSPERAFRALASREIVEWWVRPGVFDTREWTGDVRVKGGWRASGLSKGQPYALAGEFLEVDPPRKLVHSWQGVGAPGEPTTVTYLLEPVEGGTLITLRHTGFTSRDTCTNTCVGWETSLERLAEILG